MFAHNEEVVDASDTDTRFGSNLLARGRVRLQTTIIAAMGEYNIAAVGQVFGELYEGETVMGEFDFSDQGRALMASENRGRLRVCRPECRAIGRRRAVRAVQRAPRARACLCDP